MHDWQRDPFARGAYSYVVVGGDRARETLAKPLRRTLYFAGEATIPPVIRAHTWRSLFHDADRVGDTRFVRMLTPGARQLLGLRTVFALPALDLVVLDEPWTGLDPDAARWLSCAVRARRDAGAALMLSSTRLTELAGVCTRYLFLEQGAATTLEAADLSPDGTATAELLLATFERLRGSRMFRIVH